MKIKTLKPIERPSFVDAMQRALRGYQWLNEVEPGWQNDVEPSVLQMDVCSFCIIGQVYGNFSHITLDEEFGGYGFTPMQAAWLGFEMRGTEGTEDDFTDPSVSSSQDYSMLQEAWILLLQHDNWEESIDPIDKIVTRY